jgi:hypothetical protein
MKIDPPISNYPRLSFHRPAFAPSGLRERQIGGGAMGMGGMGRGMGGMRSLKLKRE